jgi:hypothetical protein
LYSRKQQHYCDQIPTYLNFSSKVSKRIRTIENKGIWTETNIGKRKTKRLEKNTAHLPNTWTMTDFQTLLFSTSQSNSDTHINMKMELKKVGYSLNSSGWTQGRENCEAVM